MPDWTCPACARTFGKQGQSHVCLPALTVESYLATQPPYFRDVFEAVASHFASLGPLHIEALHIGMQFKRGPMLAELRPMRGRARLILMLPRRIDDPRVARVDRPSTRRPTARIAHYIDLRSSAEVDATLRSWLTEGYESAGIANRKL